DARCPMPDARCPMPDARCRIVPHLSEKGDIKCFNYSGLVTKSSKKFMINPEKSVILVFYFLLK
ncbi:hypothetical protein QT970_24850, partial [Microcoleus sp. herbarium8]